ncbi:hypothetical protein D3C72_2025580 [compost metagenome]
MERTAVVTWLAPVSLPALLPLAMSDEPASGAVDVVPLPFPFDDDPFAADDDPFPLTGGSSWSSASPTLLSLPVSPTLPIGTSLRVSVMKAFFVS